MLPVAMVHGMRLTIIGGGGFRVPLVHRALMSEDSGVDTVVLHDVDPTRVRAIKAVLDESAGGRRPEVLIEDDLAKALTGTDFVFSAIRVGGLRGRTCDERSALAEGVLGQETTGAGGICYGLRTVPVALRIAEAVREHAPSAWVINFTNPAGMVTEAMSRVLGDRVIGICDSPVGLFRRVARALGIDVADAWFDYAGLNHLGWLRRVLVDGRDALPGLLADDDALGSFEEGQLFGGHVAAGARVDPQRVPLLLLLHPGRHRVDHRRSGHARRVSAAPAGGLLPSRRLRISPGCGRPLGSGPPGTGSDVHGGEPCRVRCRGAERG